MKRKLVLIGISITFVLFLIWLFYINNNEDGVPVGSVSIVGSGSSSDELDSDGDGIPNWLEDILETDSSNPSSFPYKKDIIEENTFSINDRVYAGPGEESTEILRKLFLDREDLTEVEKAKLSEDTVNYLLDQVDNKVRPTIDVSIKETVDEKKLANDFLQALLPISQTKRSINDVVLDLLNNPQNKKEGLLLREQCNQTLNNIPLEVPSKVYESYYLVVHRVSYLCKALDVALDQTSLEDGLFVLELLATIPLDETKLKEFEGNGEAFFVNQIRKTLEILNN